MYIWQYLITFEPVCFKDKNRNTCSLFCQFWKENLMSYFRYFVSFEKKIWCHMLSILSVLKRLIDPLWVFCRHWKESCGFHCFPSVQNGRSFSLLLTQRSHHTCTFWAMLGMYVNKYGPVGSLDIQPLSFCLFLSFYQRLEYILSLLIYTDSSFVTLWQWKVKSTCLQLFLWIRAAQFWSWSNMYSFTLS